MKFETVLASEKHVEEVGRPSTYTREKNTVPGQQIMFHTGPASFKLLNPFIYRSFLWCIVSILHYESL